MSDRETSYQSRDDMQITIIELRRKNEMQREEIEKLRERLRLAQMTDIVKPVDCGHDFGGK